MISIALRKLNPTISVLLLLNVSARSVLGCRAYCKNTQVHCLKKRHLNNWGIAWGKELAVQAQLKAKWEVEKMQQLTGKFSSLFNLSNLITSNIYFDLNPIFTYYRS